MKFERRPYYEIMLAQPTCSARNNQMPTVTPPAAFFVLCSILSQLYTTKILMERCEKCGVTQDAFTCRGGHQSEPWRHSAPGSGFQASPSP